MAKRNKKGKTKSWGEDNIQRAIQMVENGYAIRQAAIANNIVPATLRFRIVRNNQLKAMGKPKTMTDFDEGQLCNYISFMSNVGQPITPQWVIDTAVRIQRTR